MLELVRGIPFIIANILYITFGRFVLSRAHLAVHISVIIFDKWPLEFAIYYMYVRELPNFPLKFTD